jgi:hypothetical protein
MSARTQLTPQTSLNISALNLFASKEKRLTQAFNAANLRAPVASVLIGKQNLICPQHDDPGMGSSCCSYFLKLL